MNYDGTNLCPELGPFTLREYGVSYQFPDVPIFEMYVTILTAEVKEKFSVSLW